MGELRNNAVYFVLGFVLALTVSLLFPGHSGPGSREGAIGRSVQHSDGKCAQFHLPNLCIDAAAVGYRCTWDRTATVCRGAGSETLLSHAHPPHPPPPSLPAVYTLPSQRNIEDKTLCGGETCHAMAMCSNGNGEGRCTCLEGYVGDGRWCGKVPVTNNAANAHNAASNAEEKRDDGVVAETATGGGEEGGGEVPLDGSAYTPKASVWAPERAVCNGNHTKQGYPELLRKFQSSVAGLRLHEDKLAHYSGFVQFARSRADSNGMIVLTVATSPYRRPLMNWLHAAAACGLTNYVVVAMDGELYEFLTTLGIPSYMGSAEMERTAKLFELDFAKSRLKVVWALRYLLLRALLVSGVTVLQCDVDALLLRNPIPMLAEIKGDVVGQRGTFPFRINLSWGSTLCFGVIMYRPSAATLAWFDMALPRFYEIGDDQSEFQRAIDACTLVVWNHGSTWPESRQEHRSLKPKPVSDKIDYGVTLQPITTEGTRLNITLLPSTKFPRKCGEGVGFPEQQDTCLVAHCISPKGSGAHKLAANAKRNMTFLRPGWDSEVHQLGESAEDFLIRLGSGTHPSFRSGASPISNT